MKKKNEYENNKGITLIALIITIIVLLILAGVSLSLMLGEDGIIKQARNASKTSGIQETIEKIKLSISSAQIYGLGNVDEDALKKDLTEYFGTDGYTIQGNSQEGWTVTVVKDEVSYFINANGSYEETEYEEPIDNSESFVLGLVDDLGTRSTIYLYNNTDKITDGDITITMPDSSTETIVAQADTSNIEHDENENRYATYTVSKNGTYTFKATDGTTETETTIRVKNIEKFTKVDEMGLSYVNSENKAYSYKGAAVPKGYFVDTKSTVNTGLVITDSIDAEGYSTGNEWVWVPVNSTIGNKEYYLTTSSENITDSIDVPYTKYSKLWTFESGATSKMDLSNPQVKPSSSDGFREPAVVVRRDLQYYDRMKNRETGNYFTSTEGISGVASQYVKDYENMVTSIDKYEGFYIGRYEVTEVEGVAKEQPGESLTAMDWYYLYNQCMTLGKDNTESAMIYGTLWDATMQWLAKSGKSVGQTDDNYSGYGNYKSEAVTVKQDDITVTVKPYAESFSESRVLKTGQTSYTRSNNIYDLAGNCWDWTQEAYSDFGRILRGGAYFYLCSGPEERGWDDSSESEALPTSRAQIYIK